MNFLIIPLAIFIVSVAGIFYISYKKFAYIKRLTLEHDASVPKSFNLLGFSRLMFPEIFDGLQKLNVLSHKPKILMESEKVLRKMRLVSLRVDNLSKNLIDKIRTSHAETLEKKSAIEESIAHSQDSNNQLESESGWKKEEHDLIVEIAKDPKNPVLYKTLGDLYLKEEQFNDAKESYASAMKLDPEMKGLKRRLDTMEKILQVNTDKI